MSIVPIETFNRFVEFLIKNKIDIDTGCVAGGELTSIVVGKYRKIVTESVPAGEKLKGNKHELYNFFI